MFLRVLILIVVDNGLVHGDIRHTAMSARQVLILIVVDNGLVHVQLPTQIVGIFSLNPYCSGQWSRTFAHGKRKMLVMSS